MEGFVETMFLTNKDLRIGNYVNYENTTHVVTELHGDKLIHHWINTSSDGYVTPYKAILSIPVNIPEINKFGFFEDFNRQENIYYHDNNGYCIFDAVTRYWLCKLEDNNLIKLASFDFVHELQNLYFFHTKKELEY